MGIIRFLQSKAHKPNNGDLVKTHFLVLKKGCVSGGGSLTQGAKSVRRHTSTPLAKSCKPPGK